MRPTSGGAAGGAAVVSANATAGDLEEGAVALVRGNQRQHLARDGGVGGLAGQPGHPVGRRTGQAFVEEGVDPRPLLAGHAPPSSFFSHARATIHDRLTVAGETPSTSAVSSIVRPPK